MPTWSYDPSQVSFSLVVNTDAGLEVSSISAEDYAEGTFIRLSRGRPMWSKRVGATGSVTRSKSNDKTGSATLVLEQGSAINAQLQAMAAADEATNKGYAALLVKDKNGGDLASGKNAWVVQRPDMMKANEAGPIEWVFDIDVLDIVHGGLEEM